MPYFKTFFIFLCFCYLAGWVVAQKKIDNKIVETRHFSQAKIETYKNNKHFDYGREVSPERLSLWERIKRWFWQKFLSALIDTEKRSVWTYILYAFCILTIVYLVLKLIGADKNLFFYRRKAQSTLNFQNLAQNIHSTNFDLLIQEAIEQQDYQQAIRLYYLKTLKILTDKNLIQWQADKTNYDYARELQNTTHKSVFQNITFYFDYTFYGHFVLSAQDFAKAQQSFLDLEKNIA